MQQDTYVKVFQRCEKCDGRGERRDEAGELVPCDNCTEVKGLQSKLATLDQLSELLELKSDAQLDAQIDARMKRRDDDERRRRAAPGFRS